MGRDWLRKFEVVLSRLCNHVGTGANQSSLEQVLSKQVEVFGDQLGTLRGYKAKLYVDENAQSKFYKTRSVPFAYKKLVEE